MGEGGKCSRGEDHESTKARNGRREKLSIEHERDSRDEPVGANEANFRPSPRSHSLPLACFPLPPLCFAFSCFRDPQLSVSAPQCALSPPPHRLPSPRRALAILSCECVSGRGKEQMAHAPRGNRPCLRRIQRTVWRGATAQAGLTGPRRKSVAQTSAAAYGSTRSAAPTHPGPGSRPPLPGAAALTASRIACRGGHPAGRTSSAPSSGRRGSRARRGGADHWFRHRSESGPEPRPA